MLKADKFFASIEKIGVLSQKNLAQVLKKEIPPNQIIRLLSCSNLKSAEALSKLLPNKIIATNDIVRIHPDGGITTIARSGNSTQKWDVLQGGKKVAGETHTPIPPSTANEGRYVRMGLNDFPPNVQQKIQNLTPEELKAFKNDYADAKFKKAIDEKPELVEGWAVVSKADRNFRINIQNLEDISYYLKINPNEFKKGFEQAIANNKAEQYLASLRTRFNRQPSQKITAKSTTPQPESSGFRNIDVKSGKIYIDGELAKGRFDFVIKLDGTLKIGGGHWKMSDGDLLIEAAGRVKIVDGKIVRITNQSGHYKPTIDEARNFGKILKENSSNLDISKAEVVLYHWSENGPPKIIEKFIID